MSTNLPPTVVPIGSLVERFGGELRGDPATAITGVSSLELATTHQLAFLSNPRLRPLVAQTRAAAVLIRAGDVDAAAGGTTILWVVDDPYLQFARIAQFFADKEHVAPEPGVHPSAVVDPSARIHPLAHVGPMAVIGAVVEIAEDVVIGPACTIGEGVRIDSGTRLYARVTIYPHCHLGARGLIHAGVVIGADGFGFARDKEVWVKIPQTGRVVIGEDVEIGANTTIDRGAIGDTVIGNGVKIDNQVQIGHNVRIGDYTAIAGCVGIAGSAIIGQRCMLGGAAMILGHLELADDVSISVGTVIARSIHKPGLYTGFYPVSENADWEKNAVMVRHLDGLRDRVRALERQLKKGQGLT